MCFCLFLVGRGCLLLMLSQRGEPYVNVASWLDLSPIQIVETTPLDRVIEMFRALGLRYVLVTRHGQLVWRVFVCLVGGVYVTLCLSLEC